MEDLQEIYDRIKFLRGKGVKMKEIAEQIGFTPQRRLRALHDGAARLFPQPRRRHGRG